MLRSFAGALALALLLLAPDVTAQAASGPLVTGKCWCAIGWGRFMADCGSRTVTCTKPMCASACLARLPAKTSAGVLTDISAARRVRHQTRHDVDGWEPRSGSRAWDAEAPRRPGHDFRRMWSQAAAVAPSASDRDGRALPVPAGATHQRPRAVARAAIRGALAGGAAATFASAQVVEHPAGCPRTAFCGCGVARYIFGQVDGARRALWLAANWLRFPRAAPGPGMVAARAHHVFAIVRDLGNGQVLAYDPNSGGHLTRLHAVSLRGYHVVDPKG